MLLQGKNAIITGANQGFGKAIAEEFVREGANVLICARNVKLLSEVEQELRYLSSEGQKLYSYKTDISDPDDVQHLVAYSRLCFDEIDILVNNAGIYGEKGLIEETDIEKWIETININLIGTVRVTKEFVPIFKKQKFGKIVNISGGGATNPRTYFSAYSTSKAGVVRFSECIAEELKSFNIDVNCISPGALNTRILDEAISEGVEKVGKEYYERALKQKETGGDSLETGAKLCVFLASEKSDGITGKLISAKWDDWENLDKHKQELRNTDAYTLRRILPSDINPYWQEKL